MLDSFEWKMFLETEQSRISTYAVALQKKKLELKKSQDDLEKDQDEYKTDYFLLLFECAFNRSNQESEF